MTFHCGIHEGLGRNKNNCVESFSSIEELLRHIRNNHNTVLGNGRRSAKGKRRNPVTGKWEAK